MARSVPFRLNRSAVLLALLSAAFAGQAGATAGRVDFAIGAATLSGPDGQQRPLARGTEVNSGDVLRTNNGRVQMRMNDGAYISLQPNSEFGIKGYKFEGKTDGTESAFFSLLKGAMRTVTGLIGRVNRDRYQVATPTATVGIRGTGGLIQVLNDGATLVQGTSGIWFLANPAGSIDIPAGVSGIAPSDPSQPPRETADIPAAGPAPLPPQEEYAQGNQRQSDGTSVITGGVTGPVLLSGSGYAAAMAASDAGFGNIDFFGDATATFDAAGRMTSISDGLFGFYSLDAGGTHAEFGTDGIVAWGRWIGPVSGDSCGECPFSTIYTPNEGFHYVVGVPTATMPTVGTATYTLLGATQPTYTDGSDSPGTFSGSLSVTFGATATVGMNFGVSMPGRDYTLTGTAIAVGPIFSAPLTVSGSCASSCTGSVEGFFAGTNAESAGIGYEINDFAQRTGTDIVGTAAFTKTTP